jgi:hypothetical protein
MGLPVVHNNLKTLVASPSALLSSTTPEDSILSETVITLCTIVIIHAKPTRLVTNEKQVPPQGTLSFSGLFVSGPTSTRKRRVKTRRRRAPSCHAHALSLALGLLTNLAAPAYTTGRATGGRAATRLIQAIA